MNNKDIGLSTLLGGPFWIINQSLVRVLGFEPALWVTYMFSKWQYFFRIDKLDDEGFCYRTKNDVRDDTSLSFDQQTLIIKKLVEKEILQVKKKGLPARNYYKIDPNKLGEFVGKDVIEQKEKQIKKQKQVKGKVFEQLKGNPFTSQGDSQGLYNEYIINEDIINENASKEALKASPCPDFSDNLSEIKPVLKRRQIPLSEKPITVSANVREILEYWNNSGFPKHQNLDTKIYKTIVMSLRKLMGGIFFDNADVYNEFKDRKFTKDEIIQTIRNFALAALNPDYEPTNSFKEYLAKMNLPAFLYNSYSEKEKSQFCKFFENPPKLAIHTARVMNDDVPNYTKALKGLYVTKMLGGVAPVNGGFPPQIENKFIKGGKMMADWFKNNKKKLNPYFTRTVKDQVELVFESLIKQYDEINPGNLCSDYTYDTLLPKYLQEQAVLVEGGFSDGMVNMQ